jgi:hypothetical protein
MCLGRVAGNEELYWSNTTMALYFLLNRVKQFPYEIQTL